MRAFSVLVDALGMGGAGGSWVVVVMGEGGVEFGCQGNLEA